MSTTLVIVLGVIAGLFIFFVPWVLVAKYVPGFGILWPWLCFGAGVSIAVSSGGLLLIFSKAAG